MISSSPESLSNVVFVTGRATVDTVLSTMRRGAHDYLLKPSMSFA